MYLLDTNVVSELRRARPHGGVRAWLESVNAAALSLSAVTIGEIQAGIEITRETAPERAAELEVWLAAVEQTHNILPMDGPIFRVFARLMHRKSDRLMEDAMIAATAQVHGLTVATRNVRDFEVFGAPTLNPFEWRPAK